jgi:lycopene beta-cyclase
MNYDFAILGGGAAGLSLALELVGSELENKSILIVEKDAKTTNDRTWCFWTDQPSRFDGIARQVWPRLRFQSEGYERTWDLAPLRYQMVRGLDFYEYARAELARHAVTFMQGLAEVQDGNEKALIRVGSENHAANWAFDSRIRPSDVIQDPPHHNYLKQHFTGWEVESATPVFDPQTVTMFDLRTPQRGGVTFFYILPFSPTNALVEYTLFSADLLPEGEYEEALRGYLSNNLHLKDYRILESEHGVIPMTDHPFPRRLGARILAIGTRGGRVKPSTGYAFARIQRDSRRIVDSLVRTGQPFAIPPDPLRYRFYDSVVLDVFAKEPELGRPILASIFARNPVQRVLRFLDDNSSLWEDLQILRSPEAGPFLRGVGRKIAQKVSL